MNIITLGSDTSVVEGKRSKFASMLEILSQEFERIDIILQRAPSGIREYTMGNVHFHLSPWPKAFQPLFIYRKGLELIQRFQHRAIGSLEYGWCKHGLGAWLLWRKTGIPIVSEVHHVGGYPRASGPRDVLERTLMRNYLRWAKGHVATFRLVNHNECPDFLREQCGVPDSMMTIAPSAFVEEWFRPYDVPKTVDLMYCGCLARRKGLDLILNAFALVRQRRPQATLLIKGSGPLESWNWKTATRLGIAEGVQHVRWVDHPAALGKLYSGARMLVCASYSEGGPRVTVEAMGCGVPVISTRVGIMPDLIRDGENGFLVDWDAAEIAERCLQLLSDETLAREVGERGRQTVASLDRVDMIKRYAQIYKTVGRAW